MWSDPIPNKYNPEVKLYLTLLCYSPCGILRDEAQVLGIWGVKPSA